MPELKKPRHLVELIARINALAETLELDDEDAERLRSFVTAESFAQYQAGNQAGIYWARHGASY